ncbi:MAG: hypothetical protein GX591_12480 [Planctomycetes bacterium]|nr:hypothetical protein [Planctomycetota bacterium]
MRLRIILVTVHLAAVLAGGADTAAPTRAAPPRAIVAVFDFACPADGDLGADLARRLRRRLTERAEGTEVIDSLTMQSLTQRLAVTAATDADRIRSWLDEPIAATTAVWGDVAADGEAIRLEVLVLDASGAFWRRTFTDSTARARPVVVRQAAEAILDRPAWVPPQVGDEARPDPRTLGKPLNPNGSFDAGRPHPDGWDPMDGAATRLIDCDGRGQVLRINTHLDRDAWRAWRHALDRGEADAADPPAIGPAASPYRNVAGLEGVHVAGDWIEARPGSRYWLTADAQGPADAGHFPRIFVKGYADTPADALGAAALHELGLTAETFAALEEPRRRELIAADARLHPERHRREVYRWYLACRPEAGADPAAWRRHDGPFPPRGGLPANVRYLRLEVYASWPPGVYLFDNVHLYRMDSAPTAPASGTPSSPCPATTDGRR